MGNKKPAPEKTEPVSFFGEGFGIGDNTDFLNAAKAVLKKDDSEILNYGCLKMYVKPDLSDYIESETHTKLVRGIRKKLREEEGILFPVITCEIDWGLDIIKDNDIAFEVMGLVYKCWKFPPEEAGNYDMKDEVFLGAVDDLCGTIIESCGRLFSDYDFEKEVIKNEKEGYTVNLKRLQNYYRLINPNERKYFHITKKLAALDIPSAKHEIIEMYKNGKGCRKDKKQGYKNEMVSESFNNHRYYIY